jgi:hypothetical protein
MPTSNGKPPLSGQTFLSHQSHPNLPSAFNVENKPFTLPA